LIDPDMTPQLKNTESMDEIVKEFQHARLFEITGQWANLAEDREQIGKLFDNFDTSRDGKLNASELAFILKSLRCSVPEDKLQSLLELDKSGREPFLTRDKFVTLLQSTKLSKYEAVKFDLDQAIETYNQITDHATYPVSILVDRAAFQVMFPGKAGAKPASPASPKKSSAGADPASPPLVSSGTVSNLNDPDEAELESLRAKFFTLADRCKSVVFARAEPAMKKRMVTEIQKRCPQAITLAIGDGANGKMQY
jgi:hypothetical protein